MIIVFADAELVYLALEMSGINTKGISYPLMMFMFAASTFTIRRKIKDIFEPFTPLEEVTIQTRSSVAHELIYKAQSLIVNAKFYARDRYPEDPNNNEIIVKVSHNSVFFGTYEKEFLYVNPTKDSSGHWLTIPEGYAFVHKTYYMSNVSLQESVNIDNINALLKQLDNIREGYLAMNRLNRKLNSQ